MSKLPVKRSGSLPENYDPSKGLKTIASAEAAENFYRRAKDVDKLFEAVEIKLTEQRNFVLWWDEQEKLNGARGTGKKVASRTDNATIKELGLDRDTVHRWRGRLKDEHKFETSLLAAQERCRRTCEAEKGSTEQRGASGTGMEDWHTPPEYLDLVRAVLGEIDLDPSSTLKAQKRVQAKQFFTPEDNGLDHEWHGRIYMNPPYMQPWIAQFISKLVREFTNGRTTEAIALTHNYTDTSWFHEAAGNCNAICFTKGRVKFISANDEIAAPTQGQAFFYFGKKPLTFAQQFNQIGFVVELFIL